MTAPIFRLRKANHEQSFKNISRKNETELSKLIWEKKNKNHLYELKWKIVEHRKSYTPGQKICKLCVGEVQYIMFKSKQNLINKRSEFFNKCRHKMKWKVQNI